MSIDLQFDGTTACLGRDGWCQLGFAELFIMQPYGEVVIQFKDRTEMGRVQAMLHVYNPEELRTLICGLSKAYTQLLTPKEAPCPAPCTAPTAPQPSR